MGKKPVLGRKRRGGTFVIFLFPPLLSGMDPVALERYRALLLRSGRMVTTSSGKENRKQGSVNLVLDGSEGSTVLLGEGGWVVGGGSSALLYVL